MLSSNKLYKQKHMSSNVRPNSDNSFSVYDARTGATQVRVPISGQEKMAGAPQIQGDDVIVQTIEGDQMHTRIYDKRFGALKARY